MLLWWLDESGELFFFFVFFLCCSSLLFFFAVLLALCIFLVLLVLLVVIVVVVCLDSDSRIWKRHHHWGSLTVLRTGSLLCADILFLSFLLQLWLVTLLSVGGLVSFRTFCLFPLQPSPAKMKYGQIHSENTNTTTSEITNNTRAMYAKCSRMLQNHNKGTIMNCVSASLVDSTSSKWIVIFGLVQMWKPGSIHPFYHCSQCWRKSLDVQIIGEPRAPADLVSWQGPNPQYIFSLFGHRFTGDPKSLCPRIWHFSPEKTPSPGHQISGIPLPTGTPSLHVSQPPSGGNPLRYLSPSTKTGPKSCWKQRWWAFSSWIFWIFSFFWFTPPFFGCCWCHKKTYPAPQLGPWQLISWNGPSRPISVAVGLMIPMIF